MGFAFSRLAGLTRRRTRQAGVIDDMPVLRRADAHPDAPPRRPIFASAEFGESGLFAAAPATEPLAPVAGAAGADAMPRAMTPATGGEMPAAVLPVPAESAGEESDAGFAPLAAPVPPPHVEAETAIAVPEPRAPVPLDSLSIAELAQRFERGLERRRSVAPIAAPSPAADFSPAPPRVLADLPPAPPVAVRADVEPDVDEALRAALGRLQRISAR